MLVLLGALTGVVLELGEIIGKWKFRRKYADAMRTERFAEIESGEYTRVCGLLEKQIYGDIPLERYEVRTLTCFREKLLQGAKNAGAEIRLKLHFRHLEELVRETTDS